MSNETFSLTPCEPRMTAERAVTLIREYANETMSDAEFLDEVRWVIARYHHDRGE